MADHNCGMFKTVYFLNKMEKLTVAFFELYKLKNYKLVYKIYKIIKLKNMHVKTVENPKNVIAHEILKTFLVSRCIYLFLGNLDQLIFFIYD